ncbi:DUF998 domain-containing protein [Marilutibacter spongiae]|uniref:DUF998 domain-containing protein n=1 Tax=Marilutibacter spongiae TaxID=2025720 RepID=A0A7W3TK26_9GAMM|nr:DUF998 domain-containing protein [Lysobacter spongiae]MBB1059514.1 DUF998 domain-containing protein [Lysobacter spongiae]
MNRTRDALDLPARMGEIALAGICAFAAAATAAQWLRADLDWQHAPLSFYLVGPYGTWVQGAYFALALALVLLGVGWYRTLRPAARSAAPLLLFVAAAVSLAVTALAGTGRAGSSPSLEALVHGVAAQTAFLCVTVAMLLQAWRLRGDPVWRHRFAAAFALALLAFIGLWVHALWREAPRGLTQKVEILLILSWLALSAAALRNGPRGQILVPTGR